MLENITIQQQNSLPFDCKECKMRKIGGTGLIECLMEEPCQWAFSYGYSNFCSNLTVKQTHHNNGQLEGKS